jgi:hypothetical protein
MFVNNAASAIRISSGTNTAISYNIIEKSDTGHGLFIQNTPNVTLSGNTFNSQSSSSEYFSLYLKNTTTFNSAESGDNIFGENSGYGGDASSVANYEANVKNKDSF